MSYKNSLVGLAAFAAVAFGTTPTPVKVVSAPAHPTHQRAKQQATVMFYSGSLKDNLKRLATAYGWHDMVWLPNNDYQWRGTVKVSGHSFDEVLSKVLKHYPLQAQFYDGNHILVIAQRTVA